MSSRAVSECSLASNDGESNDQGGDPYSSNASGASQYEVKFILRKAPTWTEYVSEDDRSRTSLSFDPSMSEVSSTLRPSAPVLSSRQTKCVCVCKRSSCSYKGNPFIIEERDTLSIDRSSMDLLKESTCCSSAASALGNGEITPVPSGTPESQRRPSRWSLPKAWRKSSFSSAKGKRKPLRAYISTFRNPTHRKRLSRWRKILLVVGILLFLLGATYDVVMVHAIEHIMNRCVAWLKTEYLAFGSYFLALKTHWFLKHRTKQSLSGNVTAGRSPDIDLPPPPPEVYGLDEDKFNMIMEGLKFSMQIHFFSLLTKGDEKEDVIRVKDIGPLFLEITFSKETGFQVQYDRSRSNMTLSTTFEVYDIVKLFLLSNKLPSFGIQLYDHYPTSPSTLLKMVIDTLEKSHVDARFLSKIQKQLEEPDRIKRSGVKDSSKRQKAWGASPAGGGGLKTHSGTLNDIIKPYSQFARQSSSAIKERDVVLVQRTRRSNLKRYPGSGEESLRRIADDIFLPLPINTRRSFYVRMPVLQRNITLEYVGGADVSGIPSLCYELRGGFESPNGGNDSVRRSDKSVVPRQEGAKGYSGTSSNAIHSSGRIQEKDYELIDTAALGDVVLDLEPLLYDLIGDVEFLGSSVQRYPLWASTPHFLHASNQEAEFLNIKGLQPRESLHSSFVSYQPELGLPINVSLALQFNLRPPEGMQHANRLVPVAWTRLQIEELPPTLWYILWGASRARVLTMTCLMIEGLVMVGVALGLGRGRRKRRKKQEAQDNDLV